MSAAPALLQAIVEFRFFGGPRGGVKLPARDAWREKRARRPPKHLSGEYHQEVNIST